MTEPTTLDDVAILGERVYRNRIHDRVFPQLKGKFLVLDVDSGDYEIDDDDLSGEKRLQERHPNGRFYGVRIGYKTPYALGGTMEEEAA